MGTKHVVPRAEGQGGIGTATLGWGELFITNTTNDSATQGGKLTLTSNDGAAMQSGSRLGVIEFKGAESDSALIIGARIEAICDAAWTATENGASLKFYTTDGNAIESLVLTLDSNKLATFTSSVAISADVSAVNATLTGYLRGPANFVIDPVTHGNNTGTVVIAGNLQVSGTTTTVNSTIVTIDDPVFTLGGDTAPVSETTQDKGIEFRYHTGSAAKIGFFGWDDSASAFTFIADATNNSEVFSGTAGNAIFTNITGTLQTAAQTNITSVGALNGGTITSGFGAINNGASAITTTGVISGGSLDISGNADIDGTLEADVITVDGTALNTVIAGVTVTNATNSAHISVADNESTNEENLITFIENASATGNVGLESDGDFKYNPSTGTVSATIFKGNIDAVNGDFDGTLEADAITVNGTALNTVIAGVTVANATNAGTLDSIDSSSFLRSDTGDTMSGVLTMTNRLHIIGQNPIWLASNNTAKINIDARSTGDGAQLHKWNRNYQDTAYLTYYEQWYDGSSYHSIGVSGDRWKLSDGLDVSGTITGTTATFSGNIIGNSSDTMEIGAFGTGAIKRIRMTQGGEIHFGDTTTSNFLGLTEGAVNNFGDQDRLGLYCRNELKIYGNSNLLKVTIPTSGNITFAEGATFSGSITATGYNDSNWNTAYTTANAALPLSGGTVTGIINTQRDIRSAGQIRATGWYGESATTDYTGLAFEIGVSGGTAYAISYNRDTSSYGAMNFNATYFYFNNRITFAGRTAQFGIPGNGNNVEGCFLSIEGNTDTSGEGSGRLFFREHNSSTAAADSYGMSLGYRGGGTSVTTAMGNTWTGLSAVGNGEWGMWGHNNSATGALIMSGDRAGSTVRIGGNLTVGGGVNVSGTKNFYIDHPLESKKDTHSLIHASVESPEVNNLYRGKVDLINGNATVNLDTVSSMTEGTFVALNNNAQCFTTNESDWDAVKGGVDGNELTISCQNSSSTANVSWMVIANRKDIAIMESSGTDSNGNLIVEEVKVQDP